MPAAGLKLTAAGSVQPGKSTASHMPSPSVSAPGRQLPAQSSQSSAGKVHCSGAETVAVRAREQVDLVFMDCAMPEVDGFEATRRIRAWERASGVPPVPIVAMTANVMPGITEACAEAGMNDYVAKPVSLATLDATLTRWCGARQASAVMMRATRS